MKICVILNGEIIDYKSTKEIIQNKNYDYIICADGGANHTYKMGIMPNYILGDLDSVDREVVSYYEENNVIFKKFPTKKNETDTELCIYQARLLNAENIDLYGALGGRIDHMMANINLLDYIRNQGIEAKILSDKEILYIAESEEINIEGNPGDTISVIPIKGDAIGVTLRGLEYPLKDYNMKFGIPIGISNVMLSNSCSIKVNKGTLVVIRNL